MTTAHKYFDFVVDRQYLTDWNDDRLPVIHVFYVLYKDGTAEVQGNDCPAELKALVKDWEGLKEQIAQAARNNSEGHRWARDSWLSNKVPEDVDAHYNSVMHAFNPAYQ